MTAAPPKRPFWQLWRPPNAFSRGETCFSPICSLQKEHKSSRGFRVRTLAVTAAAPKRPFWQLWRPRKAFARGETCFPPNCSLQEAHRSSRLRGFRVRTFAVTAAPPKRPFWQLWRLPKAFSRGETCFSPICSLQEAHRSSRLRGFRVRTFAVTAAPPKRPFWQFWRPPKPFSRRETRVSPSCSLQEARRSSRLRGFRVRTCAVTAAPPKRPFWQLWRPPKACSRGETCFSPICSLQEAHKSSRLRGFRVRTLAVTAAPPQFWRPPKPFSRRETCVSPSCSLQEAHRSSRLRGFRVRTCAVTAAPPKRPFWQLWRPPKAFSRGETCFSPICSLQEAHKSSRLRGFRVRTSAVTAAPPKRPFWQLWKPPKPFSRGETCFPPSCSPQGAHGSSRLGGFRVRTSAVTAAPSKRPFWQLWRPPKAFSRKETCFPASRSPKRATQEERRP